MLVLKHVRILLDSCELGLVKILAENVDNGLVVNKLHQPFEGEFVQKVINVHDLLVDVPLLLV